MNYRTGKILLITSLLLLPAAWSPAWGEEPAFCIPIFIGKGHL